MIIAKTKLFIRFLLGLIFLYNQHMSFNTWETIFFFYFLTYKSKLTLSLSFCSKAQLKN